MLKPFLGLLFAGAAATAGAADRIVIQQFTGTFGNAAGVVAASKGFCAKANIECVIQPVANGPLGVQALVGKSIDVAFSATEVFVAAIAAGTKIKMVYGGYNNLSYSLMARNDLALPNAAAGYPAFMKDLKGKRIGVAARGSGTELQLVSLLTNAGMTSADVTIVPVGGPGTAYASLVVGKQIDALMLFPPVRRICLVEKNCRVLVDNKLMKWPKELADMIGAPAGLAMRTEMIESNPELVNRFIGALTQATQWIRDPANRQEFKEIMRANMVLSDLPKAEEIRSLWIDDEIADMGDGKISRPALQATAKFLQEKGFVSRAPALAEMVYEKAP
ncbi:MAG TPA: ABC transporter substrate-binding protein [Ramlibacter sp.]|nr:ABC transporter substrate-binding protein [Ramlibacter sp.]